MLTFLNGALLWGAAAGAVPVVLHLVMRRKPKQLEFPALRFVARRHEVNRRQLQLRHLLLLALRIALIALAAFALAGPSLRSGVAGAVLGEEGEPVAAAMVIDTSMRMQYRHDDRTRLQAAQEIASWLVDQLPEGSQVAVFDTRPGAAAFQVDLRAAKHRVRTLEIAPHGQPLPQVLAEARALLATSKLARKEMYVFTDLARTAWPAESAADLQKQYAKAPDVGMEVIDVGVEHPTNFALGDLRLSGEILARGSKLRVETDLTAVGPGGERSVELYLLEPAPKGTTAATDSGEHKPVRRGQWRGTVGQASSLPQGTVGEASSLPQSVDFAPILMPTVGTYQGYVQILGEDGLAADDRRYFTVEVKPSWRVLIAAPHPEGTRPGDYAFFLSAALRPESLRQTGQARFDCTVVAQSELAKTSLEPFSAVALLDPKPLEPAVWAKLGDFASAGRGVAVFLGRNAEAAALESFNQGPAQELLAGKLLRQAKSGEAGIYLSPQNYEHPILAPLRNRAGSIPWFRQPVYRYWQLSDPPAGVHVVVRFSDDGPAILERPLGRGRVVTVTTPVSDDANRNPWNRLATGDAWPAPVLAHCTFLYLVGSTDQPLNFAVGTPAVLQLSPRDNYQSYVLSTPDGSEVRVAPDLKQQVLVVPVVDQLGNYRVQAGGTAAGVDRGFSVNLPTEQTRLDRISDDQLAKLLGPIPYHLAHNRREIEVRLGSGGGVWDLFPLLILAVAVVLGLEHVTANRFYRDENPSEKPGRKRPG